MTNKLDEAAAMKHGQEKAMPEIRSMWSESRGIMQTHFRHSHLAGQAHGRSQMLKEVLSALKSYPLSDNGFVLGVALSAAASYLESHFNESAEVKG